MKPSFIRAGIAFALGISAVIAYGLWYTVIETKSAAVANLQNQIDAKTETTERITAARAVLSDIAGDEAAVQGYFVPETGVVAFINDLEARGSSQGVVVSVLSVSKDTVSTRPVISLTLSITGTFDAVMRTVGTIEYAPYDISLSSLSLAQDDANVWHANSKLLVGSIRTSKTASTTNSTSSPRTPL